MPSIRGILMSVRSRSKRPCSCINVSSAAAPSGAVTTSWPFSKRARATMPRTDSSSSATRIRGISVQSCRHVAPVKETDLHPMRFCGRRCKARAERQSFAGIENGAAWQRRPTIDLALGLVEYGEPQPRNFNRPFGYVDDRALDHQDAHAFLFDARGLHILESKPAQVHR